MNNKFAESTKFRILAFQSDVIHLDSSPAISFELIWNPFCQLYIALMLSTFIRFAFCSAIVIRASLLSLWLILKVIIHKEGLHIIMIPNYCPLQGGGVSLGYIFQSKGPLSGYLKGRSHNNIKVKRLFFSFTLLVT